MHSYSTQDAIPERRNSSITDLVNQRVVQIIPELFAELI